MQLCQYPSQSRIRRFTLEAIQIPIVYNQYGDYDPDGLLYVLEQDSQRIQRETLRRFQQTPPQPYEEVQPLVLRVNLGDTVKICFRNQLDRRLSIHVQGLAYDVATSDGTSAGFNRDSTTGGEIEYTWYADTEGVFHLHNHQWRLEADNPVSTIIDSITISPQECYTLDILYGAGSRNRVIGDVLFRTMMPADKPRNVSLTIHGHLWREQPKDDLSREIPIQGGISVGNRFDMELKGGAACPGDYLYRSGSFRWDVESGMWGIFRVMKQSIRCRCKEVCGRIFKSRK